jgi:hypothetical protein
LKSITFNNILILFGVFLFPILGFSQIITLKGYITEKDSSTSIPFAYVVNKKTGVGTVTSDKGYFEIKANPTDTMLLSCIGYIARKIAAKDILELPSYKMNQGIILFTKTYNLNTVMIRPKALSENQKSFYSGKQKEHTLKTQLIVDLKSQKIICLAIGKGSVHDFKLFKNSGIKVGDFFEGDAKIGEFVDPFTYKNRTNNIFEKRFVAAYHSASTTSNIFWTLAYLGTRRMESTYVSQFRSYSRNDGRQYHLDV